MIIGQHVKFIGDFEPLISGLPEYNIIKSYFLSKNEFFITSREFGKWEICFEVNESNSHYFYVNDSEICPLESIDSSKEE